MAVNDKGTTKRKTNQSAKPTAPAKPKIAAAKTAPRKVTASVKAVSKSNPANGKVKAEMNNFKDKATDTARNAAERGKERATEAVSGIGKLIRDSASSIDENVGKNYGDYARSAADAVDNFAGKMDTKQVDDIVGDARDFVRKSPAIAIGAAAAIGFVLSRLIRSGRDDA